MNGREHFRTIEDYLENRGWTEERGSWQMNPGHQWHRKWDALAIQIGRDEDPDEGGWTARISVTLERGV